MEHILPFKQRKTFRVQYQALRSQEPIITIQGRATPNIPIWRDYQIKFFSRTIQYDLHRQYLIKDDCQVDIRDEEGKGGIAKASLRLWTGD